MKVYAALYNYMIYESGFTTISIHKTKKGARNALAKVVKEEHESHNECYDYNARQIDFSHFGSFEAWKVDEIEILE